MPTRLHNFDLHWLLAPGEPSATPVDDSLTLERMDFPIPPKMGAAWVDVLELGPEFSLYRGIHQLRKSAFGEMIPVFDMTSAEIEPAFNAQIWVSGMGCHQEYWQGRAASPVEIWGHPGLDTFRLSQQWDMRVLVAGGGVSEMRSLIIGLTQLHTLLGEAVVEGLLQQLGLGPKTKAVTRQLPPHLGTPLKDALSDRYTGPTRRLFAQAKTLEYLGGLVDFLRTEGDQTSPRRHSKKIRELHAYLLSLEGKLPTLSQLAENFGLSAKQLNLEFKREFGQSIFEYVTRHRLEQAHAALATSNIPMKVLAERLGYSHVNHFITAFKRQYAFPPGSLRRRADRGADES
jgi:AraC-like DNA-binding protein